MFYGYLNPESTKTTSPVHLPWQEFYGYLNPESTKTGSKSVAEVAQFYGYLNPESTKTSNSFYPLALIIHNQSKVVNIYLKI